MMWELFCVALLFEFVNGFHDTGNAVATSLATRAVSPRGALLLAAIGNFCGAFLSTRVAETVGKGVIKEDFVYVPILFAGLLGALAWNLITWYFALPISSTHAMIGGLAGAAVAGFGINALNLPGMLKIYSSLLLAPCLGLIGGFLLYNLLRFSFFRHGTYDLLFLKLQLLSALFMALSHGSNDAQKMMGIISIALFSAGAMNSFHVPVWVMLLCASTLTLGTAAGGWRVINTMGNRITVLRPRHGFAAETSAFLLISAATFYGLPVSTTQVVTTSIMGVGLAGGKRNISWSVASEIGITWLLTIPCSALLGAFLYFII